MNIILQIYGMGLIEKDEYESRKTKIIDEITGVKYLYF